MAQRFDRVQLIEFSKQIFQDNPHLNRVFCTEDGNFFGERSKSDATNYAREVKQELIEIERLSNSLLSTIAQSDDPMTHDVAAIMLALSCTEDKARELIAEHKGNAAAAVGAATATINAVQQPAAKAPVKRVRKPSPPKQPANGTS